MMSRTGRATTEEALTTPAPALRPSSLRRVSRQVDGEASNRARIRALPVDPRTLYCFWKLEPKLVAGLVDELGVRAASLCQALLVVRANATSREWRAPIGAGSLYVRAVAAGQPHLIDLFLTLPSGEQRLLAASNVATPPPARASSRPAARSVRVAAGPRGARVTEIQTAAPVPGEATCDPTPLRSSWSVARRGIARRHDFDLPGASDMLVGASDSFRR